MPKCILFNNIPHSTRPFPLCPESYDFCIPLEDLKLKFIAIEDLKVRRVELFIRHKNKDLPIAKIELYHSGTIHNYEHTFASAKLLAEEIVMRFNSFSPSGQQQLNF